MKTYCILLLFLVAALDATNGVKDDYHESQKDFEKEFDMLENKEEEEVEAKILPKVEDEMNKQNEKYNKGNATSYEKMYASSSLPKEDFEKEKEGVIPEGEEKFGRIRGLIELPESEKRSSPESMAYLKSFYESVDRASEPASFDARDKDWVTVPKNQRACGSCAAFGAAGLMESCMLKAGASKANLDLSEQHFIDCGYNGKSMNGCNGAWIHAYQVFFKDQGGDGLHETDYPYLSGNPKLTCPDKKKWNSGAKVTKVANDFSCSAEKMKTLIATHGVVSGAIYASDRVFSNYGGGVVSGCTSTRVNHAALIVGYGTTDAGMDYWVVKNSWGSNWGDKGFIKIRRGTNECGLEQYCVVANCQGTGSSDSTPTTTAAPATPVKMQCDISKLFWSGITGVYRIRVRSNGVIYRSLVRCKNSICEPLKPGPSNACMYICGKNIC